MDAPAASSQLRIVTYATRRSALALSQCRAFVARLRREGAAVDTRELQVVTTGDRIQDRPLSDIGGKGLFVKEIEEALLDRRADFAVHSIKDVPGVLPATLVITCVPVREDPRDALVSPRFDSFDALPRGARVGTSSLRRAVALRSRRPDLVVVPLRGNVDTRLRKVDAGEFDAIVLACAGLVRLGLEHRTTERLDADVSLPAPGQGALGIECREDDGATRALLSPLHDTETAVCVSTERGVLVAVGGDCKTPLGVFAEREGDSIRVRAFIANVDGTEPQSLDHHELWPGSEAAGERLGFALGQRFTR